MKICLEVNKWERKPFSELLIIFNSKLEEIENIEKANPKLSSTVARRTSRAGTWKIPENFAKFRQDTVDLSADHRRRSVSILTNESEIPPPYSERRSSSRRSTPSRTVSPTAPSCVDDVIESDRLLNRSATTEYV